MNKLTKAEQRVFESACILISSIIGGGAIALIAIIISKF